MTDHGKTRIEIKSDDLPVVMIVPNGFMKDAHVERIHEFVKEVADDPGVKKVLILEGPPGCEIRIVPARDLVHGKVEIVETEP